PPLQNECASTAEKAAHQTDQRHAILLKPDRFGKLFDRKWRVRIHFAIARSICVLRRRDRGVHLVEFGHESVGPGVFHRSWTSSACATLTSASGSKVFNSEMETAGSSRMNRNMQAE